MAQKQEMMIPRNQEGSSGSYTDEADNFEEVVKSTDCRKILFNYLKKVEQKMNIFRC